METNPKVETIPTSQGDPADLETRDMMLNIGPAHPAMHGIVRIVAELDGEKIEIYLKDTGSPALIRDPADFDSIYVIMPMKG